MVYHALLNDKIACEQNGTDFSVPQRIGGCYTKCLMK